MPEEDRRQIDRWKAIKRHVRQIERTCEPGDLSCRPRQRQALVHWAYDSRRYWNSSQVAQLVRQTRYSAAVLTRSRWRRRSARQN
jgi:hypothetical protein